MLSRQLLVGLALAGVSQPRIYGMLIEARIATLIAGTQEEEDHILDLLDVTCDWVHPDRRLPYRERSRW